MIKFPEKFTLYGSSEEMLMVGGIVVLAAEMAVCAF